MGYRRLSVGSMQARLGLALLVFMLLLALARAAAGDWHLSPIGYGQTARNLINHRHHGWTYYFDARRGDLVTITVNALDGDLDPYVYLQDIRGNTLAEDDDSGEGLNARLVYGVREDGRYQIFITRFQGDRAPTAGRFELTLDGVPNGMFGSLPAGHEELPYGASLSNNITAERREVMYAIPGWRGDTISLAVSRRGGDFTPSVEVYLPRSARPFLSGVADDAGRIIIEGLSLPRFGYYRVRVAPAPGDSPDVGGAFQIGVQGVQGQPPERREGVHVEPLALGARAAGVLNDDAPERYYTFEGAQGVFVRAALSVTGGDLSPLLVLLDENGDEIAFSDAPGEAQIAQARLPAAGRYMLVAGRSSGAGEFALEARALAGDEIALTEGDVSVTLRWDAATDLELVVRDPAGHAPSPAEREIGSGGVLEVDANAGCAANISEPVEHVYWPAPAPGGFYEVVVWNRDACEATGATAFELVIRVGGEEIMREQGELLAGGQYRAVFFR